MMLQAQQAYQSSTPQYTPDEKCLHQVSNADEMARGEVNTAPAPLWAPLALLLEEDDVFFSEQLPELVKANEFSPYDAMLWHPRVLARLCALSDPLFSAALLTLAKPD